MRVDYDKDQLAYALANALKERDEAREKYATEATEHMLAVNKLCGKRDETLEKLNLLRQSLYDSQDEVLRLTLENRDISQELDEATATIMKIEKIFIDSVDMHDDWMKVGYIAREYFKK
jgi:hypothetical protein